MAAIEYSRRTVYAEKAGEISLVGLLFVLPFEGLRTVEEIGFFTLLAAFIAHRVYGRNRRFPETLLPSKRLALFLLLSLGWSLLVVFWAIDPLYSLNEVADKLARQYALYFLAVYFIKGMAQTPGRLRLLLLPLAVSLGIMSLAACYQFYEMPVLFHNRVTALTGAFYRLSVFLVLSIPVVVGLVFLLRGWQRRILMLILPLALAALFFTFTRAAWIAVTVEVLTLVVLFSRKYWKVIFAGIVAASLFFGVMSYYSSSYRTLVIHGSEKPRIEGLARSLEIIRMNPLTGIGFGKRTFAKYFPDLTEVRHAHNIFLNTAVETGLPGLVFFLAIVVTIIKTFTDALRKELSPERRWLLAAIFASIIGFFTLNLFDYMYLGWPGQMFWILVGFGHVVAYPRTVPPGEEE